MTEIQKVDHTQVDKISLETKIVNQAINQYSAMLENKVFDKPDNYSYKNAIQQARYLLTKPLEYGQNAGKNLVQICSPQSVLQAVMEMAQKGLNPDKKQCYFIPYGNTCTLSISYQGNVALAKRNGEDIGDVYGYAIYKDDEFSVKFNTQKGIMEVEKYVPNVSNWSKDNIVGAFAVITDRAGDVKYTEYMTMEQIRTAWEMGAAKGNSKAHRNFPDQQAIKTVKSRAVKSFVNTSDDSEIVSESDKSVTYTDKELSQELETKANTLELDFDRAIESNEEKEEKPIKKDASSNVDYDTGEIIEEDIEDEIVEELEGQSDFFEADFTELDRAPF